MGRLSFQLGRSRGISLSGFWGVGYILWGQHLTAVGLDDFVSSFNPACLFYEIPHQRITTITPISLLMVDYALLQFYLACVVPRLLFLYIN